MSYAVICAKCGELTGLTSERLCPAVYCQTCFRKQTVADFNYLHALAVAYLTGGRIIDPTDIAHHAYRVMSKLREIANNKGFEGA